MEHTKIRAIERDLDMLKEQGNSAVQEVVAQAFKALSARKWEEATQLRTSARDLHEPTTSIVQVLVDKEVCSTRAHARRMILQGAVLVDGTAVKDPKQGILTSQVVRIKGKELQ